MVNKTIEFTTSAFRRMAKRQITKCLSAETTMVTADEWRGFTQALYTMGELEWDERGELLMYIAAVESCHIGDIEDALEEVKA